jgi:hypothetical protein
MLTCLKDWELEEKREQHSAVDTKELEDTFKNLYLDEPEGEEEASGG